MCGCGHTPPYKVNQHWMCVHCSEYINELLEAEEEQKEMKRQMKSWRWETETNG